MSETQKIYRMIGIDEEGPFYREMELADWARDMELQDHEDWKGLILHRRRFVREDPEDLAARVDLGEAYLLAGQPKKALATLGEAYRRDAEWPEVASLIIEALLALGRTERDFAWKESPWVARLDEETFQACAARLSKLPEEDALEAWELYEPFLRADWTTFGAWGLVQALSRDERFEVLEPEAGIEAFVRLRPGAWQAGEILASRTDFRSSVTAFPVS